MSQGTFVEIGAGAQPRKVILETGLPQEHAGVLRATRMLAANMDFSQ